MVLKNSLKVYKTFSPWWKEENGTIKLEVFVAAIIL